MDIQKTLLGAIAYVFAYRESLLKAMLIPGAILTVPTVFRLSEQGEEFVLLHWFLTLIANLMLAVSVHRIVILGPESNPVWGVHRPSWRLLRFMGYVAGLAIILTVVSFLQFVPVLGWFLALLALSYLAGRLSLVFPAAATDEQCSFKGSWAATSRYQVQMMVVVAVFPALLNIPLYLLKFIPYTEVVVMALYLITSMLTVAALSVAFKVIFQKEVRS